MEEFLQQFALDSAKNLKNLQRLLQSAKKISDSERREIFRTLHTIKGTAQTFGFSDSSRLAHELENILSAEKFITPENFQSLFTEGIRFLINSFEQKNFIFPAHFVEKTYRTIPEHLQFQKSFNIFLPEIPVEIVEALSQTEKIALDSALKLGRDVYCFEVSFDIADFAAKLIKCREDLTEAGDIIATFPGAEFNAHGKIGFRILCASLAEKSRIEEIAETYDANISFDISAEKFTGDLPGIVSKAVKHGQDLARKFGKDVDFKIFVEKINVSDEQLKLVFKILLHFIRNALDHGVGNSGGKVQIDLKKKKKGLSLIVTDNGGGIDLEKLKTKAAEKNLISAKENVTEDAALNLIFQSELSTAAEITEISGRGVGLNAVKTAVEDVGGTIKVKSRAGTGTTFEVFLPQ